MSLLCVFRKICNVLTFTIKTHRMRLHFRKFTLNTMEKHIKSHKSNKTNETSIFLPYIQNFLFFYTHLYSKVNTQIQTLRSIWIHKAKHGTNSGQNTLDWLVTADNLKLAWVIRGRNLIAGSRFVSVSVYLLFGIPSGPCSISCWCLYGGKGM